MVDAKDANIEMMAPEIQESGMVPQSECITMDAARMCRDYLRGTCSRQNCKFSHSMPDKSLFKSLFTFCHDFQNKGCPRPNCRFIHCTVEEQEIFYNTGQLPRKSQGVEFNHDRETGNLHHYYNIIQPPIIHHYPLTNQTSMMINGSESPMPIEKIHIIRSIDSHVYKSLRNDSHSPAKRICTHSETDVQETIAGVKEGCGNCDLLSQRILVLQDSLDTVLKKASELERSNQQLTTMNEFLLDQTASLRGFTRTQEATVSMAPVVSLSAQLPALVPALGTLGTATSQPSALLGPLGPTVTSQASAILATPQPQLIAVSTTTQQQLISNTGIIVSTAPTQHLMAVSTAGALMASGASAMAIAPAALQSAARQLAMPPPSLAQPAPQLLTSATQAQAQMAQQLVQAQQSVQQLAQQTQQLAQQTQQLTQQPTQQLVCDTSQAQSIISYPISQSILPH